MGEKVVGRTRHGEISIDQLAEIQPGMARIMDEVARRFWYLYYAAKGGNWQLAAEELGGVVTALRVAKVTRPKYADDLAAFEAEYLKPSQEAIANKSWEKFEAAYWRSVEASDRYHDKYGVSYVRYMLPSEPPKHLYLGPPEKFKRSERKISG